MFIIKLKKSASPEEMNAKLKALHSNYYFNSETENKAWLDDINNNPKAPQAHLKPKGKNLSMKALKEIFPRDTKPGFMYVDCSYSRLDNSEAIKLIKFIKQNKDSIHFLRNADDFIEKIDITNDEVLSLLNDLNRRRLPRLETPKDMRQEMPQSGQILAKTWGPNGSRVWLLFGKVEKDRPVFLKKDKYVRKGLNNLHKDDKGRGFLLMPLYDFSPNFAEVVTKAAWEMSIREHPNFLLCALYGNCFTIENVKETAESFAEFYTIEELVTRFDEQLRSISRIYPIDNYKHNGISFIGTKNIYSFKANSDHTKAQAAFLNTLMLAVEMATNKENAFQVVDAIVQEA